jgi:hypothetical protein
MAMLREVYGHPELHLPQAQDAGPNGVITIRTTYQHAYECDIECCEYAEAIIESEALAVKHSTGSFKSVEGVKEVPLDPSSSNSKTV